MPYSIVVCALLAVAATALDAAARALRLSTRFVWLAALGGTTLLSATSLLHGVRPSAPAASLSSASLIRSAELKGEPRSVELAVPDRVSTSFLERLLQSPRVARRRVDRLLGTLRQPRLDRLASWNTALASLDIALAAFALLYLMSAVLFLRRLARRFDRESVDGCNVLVSRDAGPAILGIIRPRLVFPRWVLELPASDRRLILAHEQRHIAAHDPATFAVGLVLVALAPWNVGLWYVVSRLRLAIESDCDRHVVASA